MLPDGKARLDGTKCSVTLSRSGRMFSWMAFTCALGWMETARSVPAIILDHVCQFNDIFAFLIFLTAFKCMFIFPAQSGFAVFTVNVCNRV